MRPKHPAHAEERGPSAHCLQILKKRLHQIWKEAIIEGQGHHRGGSPADHAGCRAGGWSSAPAGPGRLLSSFPKGLTQRLRILVRGGSAGRRGRLRPAGPEEQKESARPEEPSRSPMGMQPTAGNPRTSSGTHGRIAPSSNALITPPHCLWTSAARAAHGPRHTKRAHPRTRRSTTITMKNRKR